MCWGKSNYISEPDRNEFAERNFPNTGQGSLVKGDVYGMILSVNGFRAIADENAKDGTTFRIQFKNRVNIQTAICKIKEAYGLADDQIVENTALLSLMGQSENSSETNEVMLLKKAAPYSQGIE